MSQKWADYAITGVHYGRTGQNNQWKRIVEVQARTDNGEKLGAVEVRKRQDIVDAIKRGQTFVTATKGNTNSYDQGAKVEIVRINNTEYIRTDRDSTTEDNLGSLPEF
jgi:hypothetical protein